ncbi:hypothetical protein E2C00_17055 [Streptomyces sp. WAC05374]|uniref:hypothetical protein n=1 Tax=unclassified Streptomyces TaxID=2593676 RepID=UPI000F87B506|nr:hypothetical protein [Streptomyces sp. WAC05374]RST09550.1 hypothetical protein EF905_29130 [Streptomyces sp. WAC05374]TDF54631.1 hypothetical protein E2C00_17055 [Streptomyces sp. WAC05374]TDF56266.1 hypothetical protein E2C02_12510 [Streptomyces sp. WAC05374]
MTGFRTLRTSAALLSAATALVVFTTPGAQAAPAASSYGCPSGAFCIYPQNAGWNNGVPSNVYWSRGVHPLYNQYGTHTVFNNQTDGWKVEFCYNANGTDCPWLIGPGWAGDIDLEEMNSIILHP